MARRSANAPSRSAGRNGRMMARVLRWTPPTCKNTRTKRNEASAIRASTFSKHGRSLKRPLATPGVALAQNISQVIDGRAYRKAAEAKAAEQDRLTDRRKMEAH